MSLFPVHRFAMLAVLAAAGVSLLGSGPVMAGPPPPSAAAIPAPTPPASGPVMIVVFKDRVNAAAKAARLGVRPQFVYRYALSGFAAPLSAEQQARLTADRDVLMVTFADRDAVPTHGVGPPLPPQPAQVVAFGVRRVGALASQYGAHRRTRRSDGR